MKIIVDFDVIPDRYAKRAPISLTRQGQPVVSFPFRVSAVPVSCRYLHWELVDPDSIPVCGFQWIHWSLANLPIAGLAGHGLVTPTSAGPDHGPAGNQETREVSIPEDFSSRLEDLIPGVPQGRTSAASKFVMKGGAADDRSLLMRYNGPTPPDRTHDYVLRVWATPDPIAGLKEGFWLNALEHGIHQASPAPVQAEAWLPAQS